MAQALFMIRPAKEAFKDFMDPAGTVSFFQLTYYMAPLEWGMAILLWIYFSIVLKPEKDFIAGLRERVSELSKELGPISRNEIISLVIVGAAIVVMSLQVMIPPLRGFKQVGKLSSVHYSVLCAKNIAYRRFGTYTPEHRAYCCRDHEHRVRSLTDRSG